MPSVLLAPGGAELICLPNDPKVHEVLGKGVHYSKHIGSLGRIVWQQQSLLLEHNDLASKLVGTIVCGDALAIFHPGVALDDAIASLRKGSQHRQEMKMVRWDTLPPEILGNIVLMSGDSPLLICVLGQVCSSWRNSLTVERSAWQSVIFKRVVCTSPIVHTEKTCIPWMLQKAVNEGNVTAAVAGGRYFELVGCHELERIFWTRAARLGHPEGQWKLGVAIYHGTLGVAKDSEEALHWLTRAMRSMSSLVEPSYSLDIDNLLNAELPALMTRAQCHKAIRESAHILGLLHLDGDSVRQDNSAAIRWFRIAHFHGCIEAGKLLTSMFRSGMY